MLVVQPPTCVLCIYVSGSVASLLYHRCVAVYYAFTLARLRSHCNLSCIIIVSSMTSSSWQTGWDCVFDSTRVWIYNQHAFDSSETR